MFPLTSALAVSALFFSIISAEAPDLSKVSLKSVSFGGSGCVQGTKATFKQTSDGNFVATFPNITASIGPGVNVEDNRKNCQLNLDVGYPPGLQYGAVSTRYAGTTVLDKGVKGVLTTTFYFSGQTAQSSTQQSVNGPVAQGYDITQNIDDSAVLWSACGGASSLPFNVNTGFSLSATSGSACGTWTDSGDFQIAIKWRKC